MQISVAEKKPIGNSIITLYNRDQASQRFDKGKEAAGDKKPAGEKKQEKEINWIELNNEKIWLQGWK